MRNKRAMSHYFEYEQLALGDGCNDLTNSIFMILAI